MHGEMIDRHVDGLQSRYLIALNGSPAEKLVRRDLHQNRVRPRHDVLERLNELLTRQGLSSRELGLAITEHALPAYPTEQPLCHVAAQM